MAKIRRAEVTKEAMINTCGYLWNASGSFLQQAKTVSNGSFYQLMGSLTFAAFALEAFLNSAGQHVIKCWDDIERKLGPNEKLSLICETLKISRDQGRPPYHTAAQLLRFRNELAHGRSMVLTKTEIKVMGDNFESYLRQDLKTRWQEFCKVENADRVRADIREIVEAIGEAAGMEDSIFHLGSSGYTSKPLPVEDP